MSIQNALQGRSQGQCELCTSQDNLSVYELEPKRGKGEDSAVLVCGKCLSQIQSNVTDEKAWYPLKESMWSEHAPVQGLVYRILRSMGDNPWAQDLVSQLYLDEELVSWAEAGLTTEKEKEEGSAPVLDSNGTVLNAGDTVTLIKDLEVKGANFTAKRGTTVKNISLTGDPKYIEGKVNGIPIVLVAAYLKKA